jgi:uncharacterized protein (TIGR04255 family)
MNGAPSSHSFAIDLTEAFPHLSQSPVVEAVVEVRARATCAWEHNSIVAMLKSKLLEYPAIQLAQDLRDAGFFGAEGATQAGADGGARGLCFQSSDKLHIAQFNRDGFVFSRVAPYANWGQLRDEALRLWAIYRDIAQPAGIQRVGLRFINRIPMANESTALSDCLIAPPKPPAGIPVQLAAFVHHDAFAIPGHPYDVNLIRMMQPCNMAGATNALIVSIDVSTSHPFDSDTAALLQRMNDMRWLKNKTFFGCVTERALEGFR